MSRSANRFLRQWKPHQGMFESSGKLNFPPVLQHGWQALPRPKKQGAGAKTEHPPVWMGGSRGGLGLWSFGSCGLADASHLGRVKGHDQAELANCGDVVVERFGVRVVARFTSVGQHAGEAVHGVNTALATAIAHKGIAVEAVIQMVVWVAVHGQHPGAGLDELAGGHARRSERVLITPHMA